MSRSTHKLRIFKDFLENLSELSTCKRAQVGCIVYPSDFSQVYAIGYNGPPRGEKNDSCSGVQGDCGCVHAEANALLKLSTEDRDCKLLCSVSPCIHCAGLIVNSKRITNVIFLSKYRNDRGEARLRNAGIQVINIRDLLYDD